MNIFDDLKEYEEKLDAKRHQEYLDRLGLTEEEYQKIEKEKKAKKEQEKDEEIQRKAARLGLSREAYLQRKEKIEKLKSNIGCILAPLFMLVVPILLFYYIGLFFTQTSVGQFIGDIFVYGFALFLIGVGLVIIFGIGYTIYSSINDSTNDGCLSFIGAILGILLFIWIISALPRSCSNFDPDHVHIEKFHI